MKWDSWIDVSHNMTPGNFVCGYCGVNTGSSYGYQNQEYRDAQIYICTNCGAPTFFEERNQYPGPKIGREINNLPNDIQTVYDEIRDSIKNSCYTAAILLGRKLIMHITVDIAGSDEGKNFVEYIEDLKDYIPPKADSLLDSLRKLGNEKNHEIKLGSENESEKLLNFIEALLYFFYELPAEQNEN